MFVRVAVFVQFILEKVEEIVSRQLKQLRGVQTESQTSTGKDDGHTGPKEQQRPPREPAEKSDNQPTRVTVEPTVEPEGVEPGGIDYTPDIEPGADPDTPHSKRIRHPKQMWSPNPERSSREPTKPDVTTN